MRDGAGWVGLTVLAEVRTIVKSVQERISCFNEEEELVTEADDALLRVTALVKKITSVVKTNPNAISEVFRPSFEFTLKSVKNSLGSVEKKLRRIHDKFFPAKASSGLARSGVKKARQFSKAKSTAETLRDILGAASHAEGTLQFQLTPLCGAVKTDDLEYNIRRIVEQHLSQRTVSGQPSMNLLFYEKCD